MEMISHVSPHPRFTYLVEKNLLNVKKNYACLYITTISQSVLLTFLKFNILK